ncbi:MAG: PaaI family thioesterase [Pseudomonadales bacterium]|nr:PaaI family thioesterase [Pseudomonadales bacterium]
MNKFSPFANWFGIENISADERTAQIKMTVVDHHLNIYGTGHGGVALSFADHACGALLEKIAKDQFYATVTFNSAFFKPVQLGELIAEATLLNRTKSTAHIEAEVIQNGQLLFKASGSFAIRPMRD